MEIDSILEKHSRVAWILKTEDMKLNELGYRYERPDPDRAYQEASIAFAKFDKKAYANTKARITSTIPVTVEIV